jgi:peptide/nickel transport system permease protein
MAVYVQRRLLSILFVLFGITVITFLITNVVPADPARVAAGLQATEDQVAELRHKMGLDDPLHVQYWRFMSNLVRGDLGRSIVTGRAVTQDLALFFPGTLELVIVSTVMFVSLGVPLGVFAAVSRRRTARLLVKLLANAGMGVPAFWLALMLQLAFYAKLGWLPVTGRMDAGLSSPSTMTGFLLIDSVVAGRLDVFKSAILHVILPASTLAINRMGVTLRFMRAGTLEVLRQDYVRTARAKGLAEKIVLYKHVLKNALIPVVTMTGLQFGWLLGGTVYVETVFAWPGLGNYAVSSIWSFDYKPVIAVTLLMALSFSVINLLVDIAYGMLDPRIRYD